MREVSWLARAGLAGRAGFYLLLAYLVARVAAARPGPQADANGALHLIARSPLGSVPIALAAVGFAAFGVARLAGAIRDRRSGRGQRLTTGLQGAFYLGLAAMPVSFLAGDSSAGSNQSQQSTTARVLALPGGRVLVGLGGLVFVGVCLWQVRTAVTGGYLASMRTGRAPRPVPAAVRLTGRVGITVRALLFLPVGGYLLVAAVRANPRQSRGLDAALASVAAQPWGRALLGVAAAGLVVFAAYTVLEARYRDVGSGR